MPSANKYLRLTIGDKQVQVSDPEQLPISIDYALEDPDNFQNKDSSNALDIKVPATLLNDVAGNTYRNPDIMDLTEGNIFRSNQPFVLDENGYEIMNGKAFLTSVTHDSAPKEYVYNLYGDNADWKIDMEESTLFDFLQHINFVFSKDIIMASWAYDGTDPALPYVFAPIRYRLPMGGEGVDVNNVPFAIDDNMLPIYMKPSISKYWLLFWGFKAFGYRIQSQFFDSEYFRRQVMPWTWGNFLGSDGTLLDTHRFLAKSESEAYYDSPNGRHQFFWDLKVTLTPSGAFQNNPGDYTYDPGTTEMRWTYRPPFYGKLAGTFEMQVQYDSRLNHHTADSTLTIFWYKNGNKIGESQVVRLTGKDIGPSEKAGIADIFFPNAALQQPPLILEPGDYVSAKFWLNIKAPTLGFSAINATVLAFENVFTTPLGGTINFQNYTGLKNYKFLDFLRGVIDEFNLSLNTDPINKVVVMEPTHAYSITDDPTDTTPGYFVDDFIDWNGKADLSQTWQMDNFSDYNRELTFKYKDDGNDGILKLIQDRNINTLASGKYVFPERFKTGTSAIENRFFSATMHFEVKQWKILGTGSNAGIAPQMICMVPENVSNTSNSASDNTFVPKSAYYKGNIAGVGAWQFDGQIFQTFPFAFAVNYQPGGQDDPILSYSDEKINNGSGGFVIGKGLLKRFYWQRLAIMRNGQWYNTWFRLRNVDVAGQLHREYKSYKGQRWELIQITGYKPLQEVSTQCLLRRWAPISIDDFNGTYPSAANVLANNPIVLPNANVDTPSSTYLLDLVYARLMCFITDIPTL